MESVEREYEYRARQGTWGPAVLGIVGIAGAASMVYKALSYQDLSMPDWDVYLQPPSATLAWLGLAGVLGFCSLMFLNMARRRCVRLTETSLIAPSGLWLKEQRVRYDAIKGLARQAVLGMQSLLIQHSEGTIVLTEREFRPKEGFAELVELLRMRCPRAIDSPAGRSFAAKMQRNAAVSAGWLAGIGTAVLLYGVTTGKKDPMVLGVTLLVGAIAFVVSRRKMQL
jgi:hypothetical protein